eukprot:Colp12_sorted_trinity150504_noHs@6002
MVDCVNIIAIKTVKTHSQDHSISRLWSNTLAAWTHARWEEPADVCLHLRRQFCEQLMATEEQGGTHFEFLGHLKYLVKLEVTAWSGIVGKGLCELNCFTLIVYSDQLNSEGESSLMFFQAKHST